MGLESVELVMAFEEEFAISVPNEVAATWVTPRNAIDGIEKLLATSKSERVWTRDKIERTVCEIIIEQLGIRRKDFTLDSEFVRDMGVD